VPSLSQSIDGMLPEGKRSLLPPKGNASIGYCRRSVSDMGRRAGGQGIPLQRSLGWYRRDDWERIGGAIGGKY